MPYNNNGTYTNLFEAALDLYSPSILDFIDKSKFDKYSKNYNVFDPKRDLFVYKDIHSNSIPSQNVFIQTPNATKIFNSNITFPDDKIVLLYMPFFSNCDKLGVHITMRNLLEHQNCTIYDINDSTAFSFYNLFAASKADKCDYTTTCFYDERLDVIITY